jgi:hypothetical protein
MHPVELQGVFFGKPSNIPMDFPGSSLKVGDLIEINLIGNSSLHWHPIRSDITLRMFLGNEAVL